MIVLYTTFSYLKLFPDIFSYKTIIVLIYPLIGLETDIGGVDTIHRKSMFK